MTTTKTKKHASKARPPRETSASFKKQPAKTRSAGKKRTTRAERKRQIRCRTALSAAVILALFLLLKNGPLPSREGRAVNLTDSVLQYQSQVEQYCGEFSIPAFSQVVLAIMQQESAGAVPDVMQASESPFNTWYSNSPNSITDPDYSIRVGVETFAYCLNEAECSSPRDRNGLKLALQNYNYGNSYAAWALDHYGGYSKDNALEFSENMKSRLGWSRYGDPEYVEHVLQYYHL